jgi:hypothetical protein
MPSIQRSTRVEAARTAGESRDIWGPLGWPRPGAVDQADRRRRIRERLLLRARLPAVVSDPLLRVGEVGTLLLRNGIVTNGLTRDFFCSGPDRGATGACGA